MGAWPQQDRWQPPTPGWQQQPGWYPETPEWQTKRPAPGWLGAYFNSSPFAYMMRESQKTGEDQNLPLDAAWGESYPKQYPAIPEPNYNEAWGEKWDDRPMGQVGVMPAGGDNDYDYPSYDGGGYNYPSYGGGYDYPSYDYPSYNYPEQAKKWYENMLQWRID